MLNNLLVLLNVVLISGEIGGVLVNTESLEGWYRFLNHCHIGGLDDAAQNRQNGIDIEREVAWTFFDERFEDLEGDLDIATRTLLTTTCALGGARVNMRAYIPYASLPDVGRGALVQEVSHLLQLTPPCAGIVEQVAQLARVCLDIRIVFLELRIALQHQHLVLRAASLPCSIHRNCRCGRLGLLPGISGTRWVVEPGKRAVAVKLGRLGCWE